MGLFARLLLLLLLQIQVAYNSMFLGEFMLPDWDMFQTLHPQAEWHAAARAVGGCPIYVSDKVDKHDFELLKKLVLPDGSILRARLPGRPTRDSLLADTCRDGKSVLKIWNLNRFGGVVGAFNCQGASWCEHVKTYSVHNSDPHPVVGAIRALDVDALATVAGENWMGDVALYSHRAGKLVRLAKGESQEVTLEKLQHEVFTVAPIKNVAPGVEFAPIGLLNMLNSGGAIVSFTYPTPTGGRNPQSSVQVGVRGCGLFGAYASVKPTSCKVDGTPKEFIFTQANGRLTLDLEYREGHVWTVDLRFDQCN